MSQLHFYVPDEIEAQIRQQAQMLHLPLSRYLADIVKREIAAQNQWPAGYFELFDQWQGEPSSKPESLVVEDRLSFD